MMKNKKLTYFLFPLAGLVWGTIGYRIYAGQNITGNKITISKKNEIPESADVTTDEIKLILDYSDPFYGDNPPKKVSSNPGKKSRQKELPIKITWPPIEFKGLVGAKSIHEQVAVLIIHQKEFIGHENEEFEGIRILKLAKDSVLLSCGNERKYFRYQN